MATLRAKRAPKKGAWVTVNLRLHKPLFEFLEEVAASARVDVNTAIVVMMAITVANDKRRSGK